MSSTTSHDQQSTHTPVGLIAFAWTLVGVPLAYGLYQTVKPRPAPSSPADRTPRSPRPRPPPAGGGRAVVCRAERAPEGSAQA